MKEDKIRIDIALVERGLVESRHKAQALIMAGYVYCNNIKIIKASQKATMSDDLIIKEKSHPYVGRGALKLEKALDVFDINVQDKIAIDVGAATGGFTDLLLRNGASQVYAVDVGYGQFDWTLRNDSRVKLMERTNARYLTEKDIDKKIDICVMDVSFISTTKIIPAITSLMSVSGEFVILIKPQFEAGKENVGKNGVVRDISIHKDVIINIFNFCKTINYKIVELDYSPITGPKGNIEYLAHIVSDISKLTEISTQKIKEVVESSHNDLK